VVATQGLVSEFHPQIFPFGFSHSRNTNVVPIPIAIPIPIPMLRKSGEKFWSAAASGIPRDAAF
jgi:hypothetical protein